MSAFRRQPEVGGGKHQHRGRCDFAVVGAAATRWIWTRHRLNRAAILQACESVSTDAAISDGADLILDGDAAFAAASAHWSGIAGR